MNLNESNIVLTNLILDVKNIHEMAIRHDVKLSLWFGNGQPGTMKRVLDDIEELKQIKWKLIGGGAVLVFVMELLHIGLEKGFNAVIR